MLDGLRRGRALFAAGDAYGSWEAAHEALSITENGLLPGLEAPWLEAFRSELEEHRLELLETVARAGVQLGDGELPEAELAARAAIEAAPFRESAQVALLEVLRRRGNVAEALVAFDRQETVQAIQAETEGNPFFIKQLVRHLEELTGDVRPAAVDALGVPAGVQDVITRRVARLPQPAAYVLRVAALIGRDFEFELLEQVADVDADTLLNALDAAVRGALLVEVPSTPGVTRLRMRCCARPWRLRSR